ncbi:MarR family winged helix-turn-helix transcriptional regulator [Kibdelosporangium persicum]|uniref:Regulatory protein MarR n=2 Tax=Kibdelosporangium persicum TaxID=2698649 RepID=A0ABX2F6F6_9PSEU|nr:Regulatory protein MarR [Kibdelosporangium persicum]
MIGLMARSSGAELALLLLGGFHTMVDEVTVELAKRGHEGVRPVHEFALRAVDAGADTASELGRRLSVTKQAAAQTIATLEAFGYVNREPDPNDARRKRVRVTPRGHELMTIGGALFDKVRSRWAARIGPEQLETLETHLAQLTERRSFTAEDLQD